MTVILVDARHFGSHMRTIRKKLHLRLHAAAGLLGVSKKEYKKYESGRAVMPEHALMRIFHHAFVGLNTRQVMHEMQRRKPMDEND